MFIIRWLIIAATVFLIGWYMPGFTVDSLYTALIVAAIFGILNAVIRPILMLFTLPVTILTLGLSTFVFSALILWFVASFVKGIAIDGFLTALIAAVIIWAVSFVSNSLLKAAK
ncbi:MAG: phage holin family protein [Patescibacteria group bacterium]